MTNDYICADFLYSDILIPSGVYAGVVDDIENGADNRVVRTEIKIIHGPYIGRSIVIWFPACGTKSSYLEKFLKIFTGEYGSSLTRLDKVLNEKFCFRLNSSVQGSERNLHTKIVPLFSVSSLY